MIDPTWRRISGLHLQEDGTIGAVWLAHDTMSSVVHLYDCALFKREVAAVISEGFGARGKWIPLAWRKEDKALADKLLAAGINVLPEHCDDTQSMAEIVSREIWQRMRTSRFRVDQTAAEWLNEYKTFYREGEKVPLDSHPLMAATRHAIEMLQWAKPQSMPGSKRSNARKVAIV